MAKLKVQKNAAVTQYCIDANYVDELIDHLPAKVEIVSILWELGGMQKNVRTTVPAELEKMGVTYMRTLQATQQVTGTFENVSRDTIVKRIKDICSLTGHNEHRLRVTSCQLKYGAEKAYFKVVTKQLTTGPKKKVRVLGMSSGTKNVNKLLAAISASKYTCNIDYVTQRTVTCSKQE